MRTLKATIFYNSINSGIGNTYVGLAGVLEYELIYFFGKIYFLCSGDFSSEQESSEETGTSTGFVEVCV